MTSLSVIDPITTLPIQTTTSSAVPSSSFISTASASSIPIQWPSSSEPSVAGLPNFVPTLFTALGAFEIGLVLAAMTFGMLVIKGVNHFRGRNTDNLVVKTMVASMLLLNTVQMIATVHAVYNAVIIDFNDLTLFEENLGDEWSILLQVLFMTLVAVIAQIFFAFRLRSVNSNMVLTLTIMFFACLELAAVVYYTSFMYTHEFIAYVLVFPGSAWPATMAFGVAAGIDVTIAAIAYVWIQKPQCKPTFGSELEYWTVKSLFGCAIVSLFNALASGIMAQNMIWIVVTFFLGNLYTLSVLLTLGSESVVRRQAPNSFQLRPRSSSHLTRPGSANTLNNDDAALWEDTIKAQTLKASMAFSHPKEREHNDDKLPPYTARSLADDHMI